MGEFLLSVVRMELRQVADIVLFRNDAAQSEYDEAKTAVDNMPTGCGPGE